ncbi:hypothetical protein HOC37_07125 [bacterium]|nr:hypothetical protein [bacterium]MBT4552730.1 hypothetical protein [bacterium]MBT5988103.1 hypothetical protein [bacterium]MBT7087353.1 hypothetical protein [bacterium]
MSVNSCAPSNGISNAIKDWSFSAEIVECFIYGMFIDSLRDVSVAGAKGEDTTELFPLEIKPPYSAIAQEA